MYVSKFDRSWLETPFFSHRFLIENPTHIQQLHEAGIQELEIDTDQGVDVIPEEVPSHPPPHEDSVQTTNNSASLLESQLTKLSDDVHPTSLSQELTEVHQSREHMLQQTREILDAVKVSGIVKGSQVKSLSQDSLQRTLGHEEVYAALVLLIDGN